MVLQVSVAVLLDNFVAASARLEREVKEERIQFPPVARQLCLWLHLSMSFVHRLLVRRY